MKKIFLLATVIFCLATANAQFSASNLYGMAAGNYTSYRGTLAKSATGVKFGIGYDLRSRASVNLTYLLGFPINQDASFVATNDFGDQINVNGKYALKISAISLMANYFFAGGTNESFGFYGNVGFSFVSASISGSPTQDYDHSYTLETTSDKAHGFTINGGLGFQMLLGPVVPFLDGGISFPANTVNGKTVSNPIPFSFNGNVGVRIPFGKKEKGQE
jgi:opacity protein-like surface antigen